MVNYTCFPCYTYIGTLFCVFTPLATTIIQRLWQGRWYNILWILHFPQQRLELNVHATTCFCFFTLDSWQHYFPKWREANLVTVTKIGLSIGNIICGNCILQEYHTIPRNWFEPGAFRARLQLLNLNTTSPKWFTITNHVKNRKSMCRCYE